MAKRQWPVGVIQICWMAPGPSISARTRTSPGLMRIEGEIFQPWPRSRAGDWPVLRGHAGLAFSPVKFSGLMERLTVFDSNDNLPRPMFNPSKPFIVPPS